MIELTTPERVLIAPSEVGFLLLAIRFGDEVNAIFSSNLFRVPFVLIFLGVFSYFIVENWDLPVQNELAPTLLGAFWGFILSQFGILLYDRQRRKHELIFMLLNARTELLKNRGTLGWIKQLLDQRRRQRDIHELGFAGTDKICCKAVENLILSPLTYEFTSRSFSSNYLLKIYQTFRLIEREIATENVGDDDYYIRHEHVNFERTLGSMDSLLEWIHDEGRRLAGRKKWKELTAESAE